MARLETYAYCSKSGHTPKASTARDRSKMRKWQQYFADPSNREFHLPRSPHWSQPDSEVFLEPSPIPKSEVIAVRVPCERLDGSVAEVSYFRWREVDLNTLLEYMRAHNASLEDMQEAYCTLCKKWQLSSSRTLAKLRRSTTKLKPAASDQPMGARLRLPSSRRSRVQ